MTREHLPLIFDSAVNSERIFVVLFENTVLKQSFDEIFIIGARNFLDYLLHKDLALKENAAKGTHFTFYVAESGQRCLDERNGEFLHEMLTFLKDHLTDDD